MVSMGRYPMDYCCSMDKHGKHGYYKLKKILSGRKAWKAWESTEDMVMHSFWGSLLHGKAWKA